MLGAVAQLEASQPHWEKVKAFRIVCNNISDTVSRFGGLAFPSSAYERSKEMNSRGL
jgi:hypothetical protein